MTISWFFTTIQQKIYKKYDDLNDSAQSIHYGRFILLSIIALGLLVRLIHFQTLTETAFIKIPLVYTQSDMYAFWQWAQTIVAGDILGRNTYHPYFRWMQEIAPELTWYRWWGGKEIFQQAPLYPYWLAGILMLTDNSLTAAILAQLVLGAFQPIVLYFLAKRLFDVKTGLVAAAVTAFYGPFIFHQSTLLRDWIPPILDPLALLAILKAKSTERRRDWCLAGAAVALALLTKETLLLFLPTIFIWILVTHRQPITRAFNAVGLLALGLFITFSPLIARNAIVGAPLFALSNRAAEGFIEGNAADGFPLGLVHPRSMKSILEKSDGRMLSVIKETLKSYEANSFHFVELQLLKLRALFDPLEIPNNVNFLYGLEISPILGFTLSYGIITPLAVGGFLFSLKSWRKHLLVWLFSCSVLLMLMSTIILGRYRLSLVPVVILYASFSFVTLIRLALRQRIFCISGLLLLIAFTALVQSFLLPIPVLRKIPSFRIDGPAYTLSSYIYASEGKFVQALEELSRFKNRVKQYESFHDDFLDISVHEGNYHVAWGLSLLEEGKVEESREQLVLAKNSYTEHLHLSSPHYNLGLLHLKLSEPLNAQSSFERFLALEPEGPRSANARQLLSDLKGLGASHRIVEMTE